MSMVKQRPMPPKSVKLPKKRKVMRQVSEKQLVLNKAYMVLRHQFLLDNPACFFNGCLSRAQEVHHRERRGKNLLNVDTFVPLCVLHHRFVHNSPAKAKELGLLK